MAKRVKHGKAYNIGEDMVRIVGNNPNITDGVSIGANTSDNLQVDNNEVIIGAEASKSGKTLYPTDNNIKVLSAQPMFNGKSPVQLLYGGMAPDKVFAMQEQYKDIHGINDDGSRQYAQFGLFKKIKGRLSKRNNNDTQTPVKEQEYVSYFDATDEQKSNLIDKKGKYNIQSVGDYGDTHFSVIEARYKSLTDSMKRKGFTSEEIDRLSPFLITQQVLEGGYKLSNDTNNFGGLLVPGTNKKMSFKSVDDFNDYYLSNLDEKWGDDYLGKGKGWRNAKTLKEYADTINREDLRLYTKEAHSEYNRQHKDKPAYIYTPLWENNNTGLMSEPKFGGIYPRVSGMIDLLKTRIEDWNNISKTNNIVKKQFGGQTNINSLGERPNAKYRKQMSNPVKKANKYYERKLKEENPKMSFPEKLDKDYKQLMSPPSLKNIKRRPYKKYKLDEFKIQIDSTKNNSENKRNKALYGIDGDGDNIFLNPSIITANGRKIRKINRRGVSGPKLGLTVPDVTLQQYDNLNPSVVTANGKPTNIRNVDSKVATPNIRLTVPETIPNQYKDLTPVTVTASGRPFGPVDLPSQVATPTIGLRNPFNAPKAVTAPTLANSVTDKYGVTTGVDGNVTSIKTPETSGLKVPTVTPKTSKSSGLPAWGADLIGAGINAAGSLISAGINQNAIDNQKFTPRQYNLLNPVKLKTKININPQLGQMRETVAQINDSIRRNSASSRSVRSGIADTRLKGLNSMMGLYGDKENKETQLINQDRLNQQQIAAQNSNRVMETVNYNITGKDALANRKAMLTAQNWINPVNVIAGTVAGPQGLLARRDARRNTAANLAMMSLAHPDATRMIMSGDGWQKAFNGYYNMLNNKVGV